MTKDSKLVNCPNGIITADILASCYLYYIIFYTIKSIKDTWEEMKLKLGLKLVRLIAISFRMERERRSQIVKTEGWEERAEIGMVLVHE